MARLSTAQWAEARNRHETYGIGIRELSKQYNVAASSVSRRAKAEGWVQGKNQELAEKKVEAIRSLAQAEDAIHSLPAPERFSVEELVRQRLQAEGVLATFDLVIAQRGIAMAQQATTPDELESLSRTSRNIRPPAQQPSTTTVNVHQAQQQSQAVHRTPEQVCAELIAQQQAEIEAEDSSVDL